MSAWRRKRGALSESLAVDPDRLRVAAHFASDKAETIRAGLQKLDATIGKELLVDGWQGRSASAYDESWLEWKQGAENVIAALEESSVQLAQAADGYSDSENANRDAIAGLLDLGP
ncbi:WXG100 family type VII secretion target [Rhodococcoides yunnanense]|uniref:WXG100 family type VII secretion target n=1 Tax=Rhodococcoides yunnanense TaxID=278209 RepID=UPI0022B119A5|nr:WXG100 family type VII secretion target [Rhodococcus yunnanensis]MCZ4278367.1 WXG100 family type VII secretion target [Rhodococcus yunnanensis]